MQREKNNNDVNTAFANSKQACPWSNANLLVGRGFSAGSYQNLVTWNCSLLTRRAVCGRATGNTIGLKREGPRQVSLPKKRYSKWIKHQWKLHSTGAAIL